MRLLVVAVGKVRSRLAPALEEYEGRASRYWKLDVIEVGAGGRSRSRSRRGR